MEACLASEACTPPRSPLIGMVIRRQCLPPSVVRSSVPEAPPSQQIFALGAEPARSLTATPETAEVQSFPAFVERKIWPASPNFQTTLPSGEVTVCRPGDNRTKVCKFLAFCSRASVTSATCEVVLPITGSCSDTLRAPPGSPDFQPPIHAVPARRYSQSRQSVCFKTRALQLQLIVPG